MDLTIADTLNKPCLREVFGSGNGATGFSIIKTLLQRLIDSFAFTTKLNDAQMEVLTVDCLDHFSCESLEDVIIFLKMARTGKFGSTKKAVDSNLLFGEWFPMYLDLKAIEREKIIADRKKIDEGKSHYVSAVQKTYALAIQRKEIIDQKESIDLMVADYDRQMLEDLITDWTKNNNPMLSYLKTKRKTIK